MTVLLLLLLAIISFAASRWWCFLPRRPLPPGPKPLPIFGNILQLRREDPLGTLSAWTKTFGPIVSLKVGARTAILLGARTSVRDLLERRAALYSSRPRLIALGGSGLDELLSVFMPYGDRWQAGHRMRLPLLNAQVPKASVTLLDASTTLCMHEIIQGGDIQDHLSMVPVRLFFSLLYGADLDSMTVDLIREQRARFERVIRSFSPLNVFLDLFPVFQSVPGIMWVLRQKSAAMMDESARETRERVEAALQHPFWNFAQALHARQPTHMAQKDFSFYLMELEMASSITLTFTLCNVVKIMLAHPEEMHQVQTEIDGRIGSSRLPTSTDLPHLPYLHAVIKECARLHPMLPLGFLHAPTEDDVYCGFRIPRDALIIPFQYALNTDGTIYHDPMRFQPRRWIENSSLPAPAGFGFGKRLCPGQPFVSDSVALTVAKLLWGFTLQDGGDAKPLLPFNALLMQQESLGHVRYACRSLTHQLTIEREAAKASFKTGPALEEICAMLALK
ncbi:cytochrome P450 [Aspergillus uvarum CBS 121591]|uniref:Cytochrome P450 n=1 Tax=Aspergillus uvarum CBS 121591 TaxID=1448315 RepID=A0A319C6N6_9EURO|nr:cytochrome P450 [Aspergillus uvarum CBS 121591]PYH79567.1 cytochrome P450 [Aspergillus uvarum CBS 121591]